MKNHTPTPQNTHSSVQDPQSPLWDGHLFLDGYGPLKTNAESVPKMNQLLEQINRDCFGGDGDINVAAVFQHDCSKNDGISGAILAPLGYLTCHTFSNRNIFFADYYSEDAQYQCEAVEAILKHYLFPAYIRRCTEDTGNGFGRHAVLRLPPQSQEDSIFLINSLIDATGMAKLTSPLALPALRSHSILQMITTSHISVRADERWTLLDFFSCRTFDMQVLYQTLADCGTKPLDVIVVGRGTSLTDKSI